MKLMFVANKLWDVYIFRGGVIKSLVEAGNEVIIVAPDDGRVDIKKELGARVIDIDVDKRGINPIKDLKMMIELYKIYKKERVNLIFHYTIKLNIFGTIAAKLAKTKSIAVLTGLGYSFVNKDIISTVAKLLYKIALNFSKEVWVLNSDDKEELIEAKVIKRDKVFILPGEGINTSKFRKEEKEDFHNVKVFLMIARAFYEKGFLEYVKAAEILKKKYSNKVEFQFLGALEESDSRAGITKEMMNHYVNKGNINYLGITNNVKEVIKNADCIVLPSYREGISRVLLEAAAMEKLIIATNVTGCKEIVRDGITGYLVPPKSVEGLVEAMEKVILLSIEDTEDFGQAARKLVVENFDERKIVEIYKEKVLKYGA